MMVTNRIEQNRVKVTVMMDEGQQTSSNINKLLISDRPKKLHLTTRSGLQRIVSRDVYEAKNNTMIS